MFTEKTEGDEAKDEGDALAKAHAGIAMGQDTTFTARKEFAATRQK